MARRLVPISLGRDLTAKVRQYIEKNNLLKSGDRVLVGVSGGVDSLCLFHLLCSLAVDMNFSLCAGHLNHGFRKEASADLEYVRSLASQWKVSFYGSFVDVPHYVREWGWSAQETARFFRYRVLLKAAHTLGANKIALAHHADDQVETVLMNLLHGSGLEGLSGMDASRSWKGVAIIRPLLDSTKNQIEDYCTENNLEPAEDLSNYKNVYRRNKVRLELVPYLEKEYNPRIREALWRTSCLANADNEYLHHQTRQLWQKLLVSQERTKIVLDGKALAMAPLSLQRRIVRKAWQMMLPSGYAPGMQHVEEVIELCSKGETGKEVDLPGKVRAYNAHERKLVFARVVEKGRGGIKPIKLDVPGSVILSEKGEKIEAQVKSPEELSWPPQSSREAYLDLEKIILPLQVKSRWSGARFAPLGMEGQTKKLKDYFGDRKIPSRERDTYPLVVSGDEVIWIVGMDISHHYRVTDKTRCVLVLKYIY